MQFNSNDPFQPAFLWRIKESKRIWTYLRPHDRLSWCHRLPVSVPIHCCSTSFPNGPAPQVVPAGLREGNKTFIISKEILQFWSNSYLLWKDCTDSFVFDLYENQFDIDIFLDHVSWYPVEMKRMFVNVKLKYLVIVYF